MSTDDDLDARLQQAGERWREANTDVATVDFAAATTVDATTATEAEPPTEVPLVHPAPRKPRRRKRIWVTAAVGVAAAVAAAIVAIQLGGRTGGAPHPAAADNPKALVEISWQLTQTRLAGAAPRPAAANASLSFDGKGQLVGNDGVAPFSGPARLGAGHIEVGDLAVAAIGGTNDDPTSAATVDAVRSVLESAGDVAWSIDGTTLTLSRAGVGWLTYRAKAKPVPTTDPKALLDVGWQLTTLRSGAGTASTPVAPASLQFDRVGAADSHLPGQVSGSDGCNGLFGQVSASAGILDITHLGGTYQACWGARVDESNAVRAVLSGKSMWSITAGQLTITKVGVGSLVYRQTTAAPTSAPSATPTR